MRVLKRDIPLSILVEILVHMVFVLSLVLTIDLLTQNDGSGLDIDKLVEENNKLKIQISTLEDENKKLLEQLNLYKSKFGQLVDTGKSRDGAPDCFNIQHPVFVLQWQSEGDISVIKGNNFSLLQSSSSNTSYFTGKIALAEISHRLHDYIEYEKSHQCKILVRFAPPSTTHKSNWIHSFNQVKMIFERSYIDPN